MPAPLPSGMRAPLAWLSVVPPEPSGVSFQVPEAEQTLWLPSPCVEAKGCRTQPDLVDKPGVYVRQRTLSAGLPRSLLRTPLPAVGKGRVAVAAGASLMWRAGGV